jgi:hypothetical protein
MVDRELTRDIRRLVEDVVPPAPWLDDRVMAAVVAAAERPGAGREHRLPLGLEVAAIAALVIAALVVGVLAGSRLGVNPSQVPSTKPVPSRDPAVLSYRELIDGDMNTVDFSDHMDSRCQTREACASSLVQTRTGVQALLRDMSRAQAPASLSATALRVEAAAQQFIVQLDVAIAVIQLPDSDYISASSAPTIHDLDLTVAAVDCWPVAPVEGGHGITCS